MHAPGFRAGARGVLGSQPVQCPACSADTHCQQPCCLSLDATNPAGVVGKAATQSSQPIRDAAVLAIDGKLATATFTLSQVGSCWAGMCG